MIRQEAHTGSDAEIRFEITKSLGSLDPSAKGGWKKELNLVSWNGREPKLDIRDWSPDHTRMGKGITLSQEEAVRLSQLLAEYFTP